MIAAANAITSSLLELTSSLARRRGRRARQYRHADGLTAATFAAPSDK
jgi:hypothetical protein